MPNALSHHGLDRALLAMAASLEEPGQEAFRSGSIPEPNLTIAIMNDKPL
jgi:hypothetical protein